MSSEEKSGYHHGDLYRTLLEEGTRLVDAGGLAAFSLRELAKAAGVSHGAPYRHFSDRNAFLEAIAAQGFGELKAACKAAVAAHPDDPRAQLMMAGRGYIEYALAHPGVLHLMFGGGLAMDRTGPMLQAAAAAAFAHLVGIVDNGCRAGLYRDESAENLTIAAWAMAHGLSLLLHAGPLHEVRRDRARLDALVTSVAQTLFNGLVSRS